MRLHKLHLLLAGNSPCSTRHDAASDRGSGTDTEELRARLPLTRNAVVSLWLPLQFLCKVMHRRCNDGKKCDFSGS